MLAGVFPVRPDRKGIPFYQAFYVWGSFPVMKAQKILAGFIRNSIVYLELMFPATALYNHMSGNDRAEVV